MNFYIMLFAKLFETIFCNQKITLIKIIISNSKITFKTIYKDVT